MEMAHWTYGDKIDGIYVKPDPNKSREFVAETQDAVIVAFSAPYWVVQRNWGWLGSVLVQFADGTKAWNGLRPRAA
jgi:hypothetical protein